MDNYLLEDLAEVRHDIWLREQIAEVQHDIWSHWMKYMFSQGVMQDGSWLMPEEKVLRWKRQMKTAYSDLTENERESDRDQADKILEI